MSLVTKVILLSLSIALGFIIGNQNIDSYRNSEAHENSNKLINNNTGTNVRMKWTLEQLEEMEEEFHKRFETIENEFYSKGLNKLKADESGYKGEYKFGLREGIGKVESEGHLYIGEWKSNMRHGLGGMSFPGGDMYISEWAYNDPHGFGIYTQSDGYKYCGEFRVGESNGFGYSRLLDGSVHIGYYKNNVPHGWGRLTDKKYIYEGYFHEGKKNGKATVIDIATGKTIFDGEYKDNYPWKAGWVNKKEE